MIYLQENLFRYRCVFTFFFCAITFKKTQIFKAETCLNYNGRCQACVHIASCVYCISEETFKSGITSDKGKCVSKKEKMKRKECVMHLPDYDNGLTCYDISSAWLVGNYEDAVESNVHYMDSTSAEEGALAEEKEISFSLDVNSESRAEYNVERVASSPNEVFNYIFFSALVFGVILLSLLCCFCFCCKSSCSCFFCGLKLAKVLSFIFCFSLKKLYSCALFFVSFFEEKQMKSITVAEPTNCVSSNSDIEKGVSAEERDKQQEDTADEKVKESRKPSRTTLRTQTKEKKKKLEERKRETLGRGNKSSSVEESLTDNRKREVRNNICLMINDCVKLERERRVLNINSAHSQSKKEFKSADRLGKSNSNNATSKIPHNTSHIEICRNSLPAGKLKNQPKALNRVEKRKTRQQGGAISSSKKEVFRKTLKGKVKNKCTSSLQTDRNFCAKTQFSASSSSLMLTGDSRFSAMPNINNYAANRHSFLPKNRFSSSLSHPFHNTYTSFSTNTNMSLSSYSQLHSPSNQTFSPYFSSASHYTSASLYPSFHHNFYTSSFQTYSSTTLSSSFTSFLDTLSHNTKNP